MYIKIVTDPALCRVCPARLGRAVFPKKEQRRGEKRTDKKHKTECGNCWEHCKKL